MIIPGGGILSNNVQDAIEEINTNKVSKSGDEINGNLGIHRDSTTTEQGADSWLQLGNEIPTGIIGNSVGKIAIFGNGSKAVILQAADSMTAINRVYTFGDRSGEVAVLSDLASKANHCNQIIYWNTTTTINLSEAGWNAATPILMYGGRGANSFVAILTEHSNEFSVIMSWGTSIQITGWTGNTPNNPGVLTLTTTTGGGSSIRFNFIW